MQLTASDPQYAFAPIMRNQPAQFAGGGSVDAAQQTQAQGRGGDTMLVHMAPSEVRGLQALAMAHGGSLTINPETGLYEAGFLKSLLPMLVGGAITAFTGIPAWMVGLGVGGATAAATGSLKKGLMAGLGAYGGAGMASGLQAAAGTTENLMAPSVAADATQASVAPSSFKAALPELGVSPSTAVPGSVGSIAQTVPQPVTGTDIFTKGIPALGSEAGRTAFMSGMSSAAPYSGMAGLAGTALSMAQTPTAAGAKPDSYIRPYDFAWNPNTQAYEPAPRPGDTSERRYFSPTFTARPIEKAPSQSVSYGYTGIPLAAAGGGLMDLAEGGQFTESPKESQFDDERGVDSYAKGGLRPKSRPLTGEEPYGFQSSRESMLAATERNFAAGGLGAARQNMAPRFLSGGGDGMSDSIRANIDGKQEARLADGEFVVPADVVSHIGNGSSKAGAKKLYGMMDRIRKARTGKERQAPAVRAEKYMPA